jgi:hypothetical protein
LFDFCTVPMVRQNSVAHGREQLFFGFNRYVFPSTLGISVMQHEHLHQLT